MLSDRGDRAPTSEDDASTLEEDRTAREFYYLNFLSVFGDQLPIDQIGRISDAALENRKLERICFRRRMSTMVDQFRSSRRDGVAPEVPGPALTGWDAEKLALVSRIREQGRGLLLGLFHFGAHRQIPVDLGTLGVPISAPIAGKAYWDIYALREEAPQDLADCLKLLEVEKRSVGRELLVDLRRGRVGALYVDGNMGPDGTFAEEGSVEVGFLGRRIRVKAGIARLSVGLGAPILPLFATSSGGKEPPRIVFGDPVFPPQRAPGGERSDAGELESTMSKLYSQLEREVRAAPASWEYGFCLHRWSAQETRQEALDADALSRAMLRFESGSMARANARRVARVVAGGQPTWVDVADQRAYRFPKWFDRCADQLQSSEGLSSEMVYGEPSAGADSSSAIELLHELVKKQLVIVEADA